MKETELLDAINMGLHELHCCGKRFNVSLPSLMHQLYSRPGASGHIILPSENADGFELTSYAPIDTSAHESTGEHLWTCVKEHYGLTAATGLSAAGAIPLEKIKLGYKVHPYSSPYTNPISHFGHKFFPRAKLPAGTLVARIAKNSVSTVRIFGVIGRVNPFIAAGLAIFDVVSIASCMNEKNG